MRQTNNTVQKVLALEAELEKMKLSDVITAEVEADNKGELMDAAKQFNARLFHPFEKADEKNDYFHFEYMLERKKGCKIVVKSKEQYRIHSTIKEI